VTNISVEDWSGLIIFFLTFAYEKSYYISDNNRWSQWSEIASLKDEAIFRVKQTWIQILKVYFIYLINLDIKFIAIL